MLDRAYKQMHRQLSRLYRDKATIYSVVPEKTKRGTINRKQMIAEDVPCKLSLGSLRASPAGQCSKEEFDAKLFLATALDIPSAATIEVTDKNGHTTVFKRSSKPYTGYLSHQEIALEHTDKAKERADGERKL